MTAPDRQTPAATNRSAHRDALMEILRSVDDAYPDRLGEWSAARTSAVRRYLLDVAGLTPDDLDAATATWQDWIVGGDLDVWAGLAAFVAGARTAARTPS